MKTLKIIMMYLSLAFIYIMCQKGGFIHDELGNDFNSLEFSIEIKEFISSDPIPFPLEKPVDCFEYAELVTGFSAEILRGIAATESYFRTDVVGDSGMSLGMFQLHSRWHESRVEKWGEFDPIDPFESAVIAGRIMQENLIAFNGNLRMAIAAYRQGVRGVRENKVTDWYVESVLNWQKDCKKVLSFFVFSGITDNEVLQNGYKGTRTQDTYKFNDSSTVQVSWRGSGDFSY